LFAQTFDAKRLELAGEPIRVADEVAYNPDGRAAFAASQNGILVYRTGSSSGTDLQLEWVDRTGKSIGTIASPAPFLGLDLSPDGKRVAIHRHDTTGGDIWIFESDRGTMSRLTFDATQDNSSPIWSPDGARILFGSQRNGKWGLYTKPANGMVLAMMSFSSSRMFAKCQWHGQAMASLSGTGLTTEKAEAATYGCCR
jgi:Tol biopolymer transport system component